MTAERIYGLLRHFLTMLGGFLLVSKGALTDGQLELWIGALLTIGVTVFAVFAPSKSGQPKRVRIFSAIRHGLTALGGAVIGMGWASAELVNGIVTAVVQFFAVKWSLQSPEKRAPSASPVDPRIFLSVVLLCAVVLISPSCTAFEVDPETGEPPLGGATAVVGKRSVIGVEFGRVGVGGWLVRPVEDAIEILRDTGVWIEPGGKN